jgi:hypothetical protein
MSLKVTLQHMSANAAGQSVLHHCPQNQMMMHHSQIDEMAMGYPNQSKRLKCVTSDIYGQYGKESLNTDISMLTE